MRSKSNFLAATCGDPCGIGHEVTAKAYRKISAKTSAPILLIGNRVLLKKHNRSIPDKIIIDPSERMKRTWTPGRPGRASGQAALMYLQCAVDLIKVGTVKSLVTAPVSKEHVRLSNKKFQGHTEYLAQAFRAPQVEMMFVAEALRIVVLTRHVALKNVSRQITEQRLGECLRITQHALKGLFKVRTPRIAVAGLNPHAGEKGAFGKEDRERILPAIQSARKRRIHAEGPFPADTLFLPENIKKFDAFITMYHDQGLIPAKALYFDKVVNCTLGLPFFRTSPSHGTAFDIAGKNQANPSSMTEAIRLALQFSR